MFQKVVTNFWPVALKAVLPAVLTAAGTTMALLWSEGFRLFCGLQ